MSDIWVNIGMAMFAAAGCLMCVAILMDIIGG